MKFLDSDGLSSFFTKLKNLFALKDELSSHTSNTTIHITSTERTNWNAAKTHADSAHAPVDAEANQNAFSNISVNSTTIAADSKTDTLTITGSNVTLTPDATNDKLTIGITKDNVTSALGYTPPTTNTTYSVATQTSNGLMSSDDKTKLDNIEDGANNYSLPTASSSTLGGVKIGTNVSISSGTISVANGTTSVKGIVQLTNSTSSTSTTTAATPSSVKSAYDLANTANTNAATAQSTADSKVGSVSLATGTNNGTVALTVDGTTTDNIAVKGLGSAAYTASSAYATSAQGTKADNAMPKSGGTFTGAVTLNADPSAALGAATKQYVDTQITNKIAASDAMVFKGTLGTNGTVTAVPTTGVVKGDTYKVITAGTYAGSSCKVGDLIIALNSGDIAANTTNWICVPSGNENETTIKYSKTTQNLTTSAQTGAITLAEGATKQVDTSISAGSASTNVPTSAAVASFVEGKGYTTNTGTITGITTSSPLSGSGTSGSVTISHANSGVTAGSYGDSAAQTPAYGGTFQVPYVTVNATGHVTGISAHTVKIPASDNTDTKVTQTAVTASDYANWRPVVFGSSNSSTEGFTPTTVTDKEYVTDVFSVQPSTGTMKATTFKGALSGNATTASSATKATQDSAGQQINTTYIKGLSVSGKTVTYTKGDGTTGTITTQDTVTTATTTGSGNAVTAISASNGALTVTKGSTFLTAHPTITTSTDSTSTASPAHGGTFTAIDSVTRDSNGHVTKVNTKTITLPADNNTDTKVTNTLATTTKAYVTGTTSSSTNTGTQVFDTGVYLDTTAGQLTATTFKGALSGNATTATTLATSRAIDGVNFNGSAAITHYGTCSTAAATAAKTVSLSNFTLVTGAKVAVKFTVTNTASSPTLNVNSTGAKAIYYRGSAISAGYLAANRVYEFVYDGTNYELVGDINTDTNTKVTNTLGTTTKAYVTGTTSSSTNTGTQIFDTGVYLDTVAGQLVVNSLKIGSGILSWDSTNNAIVISV